MEILNLVLALALPSAVGALLVARLLDSNTQGRLALALGNGILLGLLMVALMLRALDACGLALTFSAGAVPLALLLLLLIYLQFYRRGDTVGPAMGSASALGNSRAQLLLFLIFLVLIDLRILTLGLELLWRPLFPWDATMHWATKARVWFDAQAIVPFVDNHRWLQMAGQGVYTDFHPDYPITTPLLQLWVSLALGRWDESLMNLPWLLLLVGLVLAFYGQARAAGAPAVTAIVFTYLLVSLPLLGVHVALAGYADLFLGVFYGAAMMAFHNWVVDRQRGQAVLAVIFALSCPLIKNEGFFWMLTFLPALVVVFVSRRQALMLLAGGVAALALVLLLLPPEMVVAGNSMADLRLKFHPDAFLGVLASIWVLDNWHLLGCLLPALALPVLLSGGESAARYRGIGAALLSAIVLLLALFLFTKHAHGAVHSTSVGRISLHLVPGLVFLALLLWRELSCRQYAGRFSKTDVASAAISQPS